MGAHDLGPGSVRRGDRELIAVAGQDNGTAFLGRPCKPRCHHRLADPGLAADEDKRLSTRDRIVERLNEDGLLALATNDSGRRHGNRSRTWENDGRGGGGWSGRGHYSDRREPRVGGGGQFGALRRCQAERLGARGSARPARVAQAVHAQPGPFGKHLLAQARREAVLTEQPPKPAEVSAVPPVARPMPLTAVSRGSASGRIQSCLDRGTAFEFLLLPAS